MGLLTLAMIGYGAADLGTTWVGLSRGWSDMSPGIGWAWALAGPLGLLAIKVAGLGAVAAVGAWRRWGGVLVGWGWVAVSAVAVGWNVHVVWGAA